MSITPSSPERRDSVSSESSVYYDAKEEITCPDFKAGAIKVKNAMQTQQHKIAIAAGIVAFLSLAMVALYLGARCSSHNAFADSKFGQYIVKAGDTAVGKATAGHLVAGAAGLALIILGIYAAPKGIRGCKKANQKRKDYFSESAKLARAKAKRQQQAERHEEKELAKAIVNAKTDCLSRIGSDGKHTWEGVRGYLDILKGVTREPGQERASAKKECLSRIGSDGEGTWLDVQAYLNVQ